MSATQHTMPACPRCERIDSITLDTGERLCLQCHYEWNPATEHVRLRAVPDAEPLSDEGDRFVRSVLAADTAAEVLSPAMTAAELVAEHTAQLDTAPTAANLEGSFVALWDEGGEPWLVIADLGGDTLTVCSAAGSELEVRRDACTVVPEPLHTGELVHEHTATDDEPDIGTVMAVAGLILTIAADVIADDEARTLLPAPIGWLPPPANEVPEVEWGAAYAVAILVRFYGLDLVELREIASNTLAGVTATTESEQD